MFKDCSSGKDRASGKDRTSVDSRTNLEKLDDAGLVSDVVFEKYQTSVDALAPEIVDEMIAAFNHKAVDPETSSTSD